MILKRWVWQRTRRAVKQTQDIRLPTSRGMERSTPTTSVRCCRRFSTTRHKARITSRPAHGTGRATCPSKAWQPRSRSPTTPRIHPRSAWPAPAWRAGLQNPTIRSARKTRRCAGNQKNLDELNYQLFPPPGDDGSRFTTLDGLERRYAGRASPSRCSCHEGRTGAFRRSDQPRSFLRRRKLTRAAAVVSAARRESSVPFGQDLGLGPLARSRWPIWEEIFGVWGIIPTALNFDLSKARALPWTPSCEARFRVTGPEAPEPPLALRGFSSSPRRSPYQTRISGFAVPPRSSS